MTRPFDELAALDRFLHEPARLGILTALSACQSADFVFLHRLLRLNQGALSTHLAKLEQAGFVELTKAIVGKVPRTSVRLTAQGMDAITAHWKQLEALRKAAGRIDVTESLPKVTP